MPIVLAFIHLSPMSYLQVSMGFCFVLLFFFSCDEEVLIGKALRLHLGSHLITSVMYSLDYLQ